MKNELIIKFSQWLKQYSAVNLMHSIDFAEYKINLMLKSEALGEIIEEDKNTFAARYEYTFTVSPKHSTDGRAHSFNFEVEIIGIKGNVTADDYEIKDFTEYKYIIK